MLRGGGGVDGWWEVWVVGGEGGGAGRQIVVIKQKKNGYAYCSAVMPTVFDLQCELDFIFGCPRDLLRVLLRAKQTYPEAQTLPRLLF